MELQRKLAILADAAKYDASCASSGSDKRDSSRGRGIGSTEGMGICHSFAPDGRCISLLKVLLTNFCIYDCLYCVNRVSSNVPRARFTVEEVVRLTLDFYRRNYIEGLFLSSGIVRSPDHTMEQLVEVARQLRVTHDFRGYIHLKTIPDASEALLAQAGRYADRLSINVELPTEQGLQQLAPEKDGRAIRTSMARLRSHIDEAKDAAREQARPVALVRRAAPAGAEAHAGIGNRAAGGRGDGPGDGPGVVLDEAARAGRPGWTDGANGYGPARGAAPAPAGDCGLAPDAAAFATRPANGLAAVAAASHATGRAAGVSTEVTAGVRGAVSVGTSPVPEGSTPPTTAPAASAAPLPGAARTRATAGGRPSRAARARPPRFAPGGQSTQMIVGADGADDRTILLTSARLYGSYQLRRVYYSAFSPIPDASKGLPLRAPPLLREHRLYQADWLMRFYGFSADEIVPGSAAPAAPAAAGTAGQPSPLPVGMLDLDIDPKLAWALAHRDRFPVDLNRAPREMLLRVPGLGVKTVDTLLQARRARRLRCADLQRLRVSLRKVLPFVELADHHPRRALDAADLAASLRPPPVQGDLFAAPPGEGPAGDPPAGLISLGTGAAGAGASGHDMTGDGPGRDTPPPGSSSSSTVLADEWQDELAVPLPHAGLCTATDLSAVERPGASTGVSHPAELVRDGAAEAGRTAGDAGGLRTSLRIPPRGAAVASRRRGARHGSPGRPGGPGERQARHAVRRLSAMADSMDLFSPDGAPGLRSRAAASPAGHPHASPGADWVTARLCHPTDLDGFRAEARRLLSAGIAPQLVHWQVDDEAGASRGLALWPAGDPATEVRPAQVPRQEVAPAAVQPADIPPADVPPADLPPADEPPADVPPADVPPAALHPGAATRPLPSAPADDTALHGPVERAAPPAARVPAAFLTLCQRVALHRDPARWALLYRLLWRLQHEPGLRHDLADPDWLLARQMARDVQRDLHKMKAFVRFRELHGAAQGGESLFVAWFEPVHRIVDAVAPFFARRFANMHWAILTPERSIRWDGQRLQAGPGARKDDVPADDAVEGLWLTYYEHIFNPARLNLRTMAREMPRRYWANLPEARLIGPLAAGAARRSDTMVRQAPTEPRRGMRPLRSAPARPASAHAPAGDLAPDRPSLAHPASGRRGATHAVAAEAARADAVAAHGAPPDTAAAASRPALDALRPQAARCRDCPLWEPATQTVFGEGDPQARLMLVGEQPGDQEDVRGRPFVGPAGKLLDRALAELGLDRDAFYVTNAVKHFKYELRGTRRIHKSPAQREIAACLHWLESEIDAIAPQAIVALGATAARALLGRPVSVTAERGRWLTRADGRPVLVTLHPSALLRLPHEERDATYALWVEDLRQLAEAGA